MWDRLRRPWGMSRSRVEGGLRFVQWKCCSIVWWMTIKSQRKLATVDIVCFASLFYRKRLFNCQKKHQIKTKNTHSPPPSSLLTMKHQSNTNNPTPLPLSPKGGNSTTSGTHECTWNLQWTRIYNGDWNLNMKQTGVKVCCEKYLACVCVCVCARARACVCMSEWVSVCVCLCVCVCTLFLFVLFFFVLCSCQKTKHIVRYCLGKSCFFTWLIYLPCFEDPLRVSEWVSVCVWSVCMCVQTSFFVCLFVCLFFLAHVKKRNTFSEIAYVSLVL